MTKTSIYEIDEIPVIVYEFIKSKPNCSYTNHWIALGGLIQYPFREILTHDDFYRWFRRHVTRRSGIFQLRRIYPGKYGFFAISTFHISPDRITFPRPRDIVLKLMKSSLKQRDEILFKLYGNKEFL